MIRERSAQTYDGSEELNENVKKKPSKLKRIKNALNLFSIIWSYLTILLFAVYGIRISGTNFGVSVLIFIVCGIYFIVNTLLVIYNDGSKKRKAVVKDAKAIFKVVSSFLKMTVAIFAIVSLGIDSTLKFEQAEKVVSIMWLGITISTSLFGITFRMVIRSVKKKFTKKVNGIKERFGSRAKPSQNGATVIDGNDVVVESVETSVD